MNILIGWLIYSIAIFITSYLLPGVSVDNITATIVTALVLGLINAFIRPVLIILTLPINILSLGLFTLVINAALILLASAIVPGFHVAGFWWAVLFSLVLSIINYALKGITKETVQDNTPHYHVH